MGPGSWSSTQFAALQARWGGVPFEVANDGEVTALAGSMALNDNAVLGISMGTSLAGGYVTPVGSITPWLNELAFAPVARRLGWRPEFPWGRLTAWQDRTPGIRFIERKPMPPLGHFSLIRYGKSNGLAQAAG